MSGYEEAVARAQANQPVPRSVERVTRELEGIHESVTQARNRTQNLRTRMYDLRVRLIGSFPVGTAEDPNVKEVAGSELAELRQTIASLEDALDDAERYMRDLEGI